MHNQAIGNAQQMRSAGPEQLAAGLADARSRLLHWADVFDAGLGGAAPYSPELNPPLWELGHVAWFEEHWIARNPQRLRGAAADPDVARARSLRNSADSCYDSSRVAHTRRWHLDLPDAAATREYMQRVRESSLALLPGAAGDDAALYFHRLALFHEDMHTEAWAYMAQHLGLACAEGFAPAPATLSAACAQAGPWAHEPGPLRAGWQGSGFAFDNELQAHEIELPGFCIDRAPVSWQRFVEFIDAGGYEQAAWWTDEGWAWRRRHSNGRPRYLRRDEAGQWERAQYGQWLALELAQPAVNLTQHEAKAWCRWAGRRLPSEYEWEAAATRAPVAGEPFEWGQVWEWTASAFAPYAGFEPHPYRDYSMPWFDGRPVLKGASFATAQAMKQPQYRNYFSADRNDIFAGFRSCAL
jgi:gamma-glutamyl hercynylcysteine S-oxide synthase